MKEQSLWTRYSDDFSFPQLLENRTADIAIVGGGICGVMTAALLADSGLKVALLEARLIGRSSSGFSTGNLYEVLGDELHELVELHGEEVGKTLVQSRREAVNLIEELVTKFKIDCDFRRIPRYFYASVKETEFYVENEAKTLALLDVPFTYDAIPDRRLQARTGVVVYDQAQFNPQRFVEQLAKIINHGNIEIYERSAVESIEKENGEFVLTTDKGVVRADKVIHATHTPKGLMTFHTLLAPYREYGLAFKLVDEAHPPGIFYGYFDKKSHFSTRSYERDGEKYLIVVGGPHKVGQGNSVEEINRLETFARSHFNVESIANSWGAQQYKSTDYLPYIGSKSKGDQVYIATGFGAHGLTYGAVAARVLTNEILGLDNPFAELYSPSRMNPLKSAPKFLKENANVFYEYVNDYLIKSYPGDMAALNDGCGKVFSFEGKKVAVSRDDEGKMHICSGVCPHLGGIVHWNEAERTWDCPLHGSRFSPNGEALEGPTFSGLEQFQLTDLEEEVKPSDWVQPGIFVSPQINDSL